MITKIKVDGFKSLTDFELALNQGLNVLIGPNGAGKSNICQALAIIGAAANNELVEYILSLGGAKNIFKMGGELNLSEDPKKFKISCYGSIDFRDQEYENNNLIKLFYENSITVSIGKQLSISEERLTVKRDKRIIARINRNPSGEVKSRIINPGLAGPRQKVFDKTASKKSELLNIEMPKHSTDSFLDLFGRLMYFIYIIYDDLKRLKVFNIDPHIAKKTSDILEPLTMLNNGKRLSNAIYDLHKNNKESLEKLNSFMVNIMPRYNKVNHELSSDGLTRSFSITDIDDIKYPAQSLSDGTVKTIAFMVGMIECDFGSIIIEEPENYLHPWACTALVEYIRENFSNRSCLITTHSETILNAIKPSEIIICTNQRGNSKAERIKNIKKINKSIEQSGFGCGYHYISGAFGGVPF